MTTKLIHVVAGFLGSGKTTLVDRLVRHYAEAGRGVGLVINEMAELDVDGAILHDHHGHRDEVHVLGLAGGCVCCDLGEELVTALTQHLRNPKVDVVLVETTGLAALAQVLAGVERATTVAEEGRIGACIGLLDAKRLAAQEARWPASDIHLSGADVVIVNHVDEASEEQRAYAARRAVTLAPNAVVVETSFAEVDCEAVLSPSHRPAPELEGQVDTLAGFSQNTFLLKRPIVLEKLAALLRRHRAVLRLKGVMFVDGREGAQLLQWSSDDARVDSSPHGGEIDVGYVVAIGRRVQWDRFMDGLSGCLAPRKRTRAKAAATTKTQPTKRPRAAALH